jgi:hypothetical protein
MPPLFRSSVTITLTPDAANRMLQILEDSVPLPPDLYNLHQYMIVQAHNQDVVVHAGVHPWSLPEPEPTPTLAPDALSSTLTDFNTLFPPYIAPNESPLQDSDPYGAAPPLADSLTPHSVLNSLCDTSNGAY